MTGVRVTFVMAIPNVRRCMYDQAVAIIDDSRIDTLKYDLYECINMDGYA